MIGILPEFGKAKEREFLLWSKAPKNDFKVVVGWFLVDGS